MSSSDIEEDIREYSEWIEKRIPINNDWIDEINYLSFIRDEIHQNIQGEKSASIVAKLQSLDRKWQKHITLQIDSNFQYTNRPLDNYTDDLWWWHIDMLDQLSTQQKSTL